MHVNNHGISVQGKSLQSVSPVSNWTKVMQCLSTLSRLKVISYHIEIFIKKSNTILKDLITIIFHLFLAWSGLTIWNTNRWIVPKIWFMLHSYWFIKCANQNILITLIMSMPVENNSRNLWHLEKILFKLHRTFCLGMDFLFLSVTHFSSLSFNSVVP